MSDVIVIKEENTVIVTERVNNVTVVKSTEAIIVNVGAVGAKGDKGDIGLTGLKGDKGDKGDNGSQGIQGTQGLQGIQGIQGLTGETGANGSQGIQGIQGIQGLQGEQGLPGVIALATLNTTIDFGTSGGYKTVSVAYPEMTLTKVLQVFFTSKMEEVAIQDIKCGEASRAAGVGFDIYGFAKDGATGVYSVRIIISGE
jgi:hypothetical protein